MSKLLSVIIPTYKRKESLGKLLKALLAQKDIRLEIVIVDQNPKGFLDEIVPQSEIIRRIFLSVPNASTARNLGFTASLGEIILFIDDDLLPEIDFCKNGIEVFNKYHEISCFSPLVYNEFGKELALKQAFAKSIKSFEANRQIFSITDTISAAIFFRREYFIKTGGFDSLLFEFAKTAEDQEFFLRIKKRNLILYYVPFVEVFHDETVPGGCDLRTEDYWITRDKCIKAWVYRRRIQHIPSGKLSVIDILQLSRSSFLNKETLTSGIKNIARNISLLKSAIKSSDFFLKPRLEGYSLAETMNHLELMSAKDF